MSKAVAAVGLHAPSRIPRPSCSRCPTTSSLGYASPLPPTARAPRGTNASSLMERRSSVGLWCKRNASLCAMRRLPPAPRDAARAVERRQHFRRARRARRPSRTCSPSRKSRSRPWTPPSRLSGLRLRSCRSRSRPCEWPSSAVSHPRRLPRARRLPWTARRRCSALNALRRSLFPAPARSRTVGAGRAPRRDPDLRTATTGRRRALTIGPTNSMTTCSASRMPGPRKKRTRAWSR
mmetsp:Transcript_37748/g.108940  ORF Transcript_37748/g.108940 Transcript_37748/m.108940 type:complete len:236 (+) Transcript_37748:293-1000(+)